MATPESLNDAEKEPMRVETLTTVCTQCGGGFVVQPSGKGNIAVPAEGTPSRCPDSNEGVHKLNLAAL